jgi:hypothetical protein
MKSPSVAPLSLTAHGDRENVSSVALIHPLRPNVDGNKIRSRLLRQLGIVHSMEGKSAFSRPQNPPGLRKVAAFSEPLKYDDRSKDEELGRSKLGKEGALRSLTQAPKKPQSVAFESNVSVIPIPKRFEYSERIRSRLWCGKRELRAMAARNTIEYRAEGWNWRTVAEDEEFIITTSGERIHPVHLRRLLSSPFLMRHPMRVLQQQHVPQMAVHRQQQHQHQQQLIKKNTGPEVDKKTVCCQDPFPTTVSEELARQ